ncbi:MAG: cysteine hydrolase [Phycisphaerae bacterium]|nr:cysteine hydrolase [Phycisphaerae bacterium]MDD5381603.1 cysteine hydrolase [Phycisphaerae bacterium]
MIRQLIKKRRKWVLIDINTQRDFFLAKGTACIRNHRKILTNVRRMMAWAKRNDVRVISTCEVYPDHNGIDEIGYCIDGTEGQKKIRYTLLSNRASFPADSSTDFPAEILRQYRQVVLHKRCVDPFEEPRIERLLSEVRADNFIIIGASAEGAVKATALGLLQRGKRVSVVTDAVGMINKREAKLAFRKMKAKGARLIETKKLAGVSHLRRVGICDCESCQKGMRKAEVKVAG